MEDESFSFYIKKPNYSFIKFLLKHDLAFEVSENLVTSSVKFVVRAEEVYSNNFIKKLYKKSIKRKDFIFYVAAYHMGFSSVFLFDHMTVVAKKPQTTVFYFHRREDLKKHKSREKLNKLSVDEIKEIQYNYSINNDKIKEFRDQKNSGKVNNDDVLVYEHDGEVIVKSDLKPNDMFDIEKAVNREGKKGNLTYKSSDLRINYLLDNMIELDKTIDFKNIKCDAKHLSVCPFCKNYCDNSSKYCKNVVRL